MLKRLSIANLAIIENIDVSFGDGFTVLTGETGAGKSLVIDSLGLLLGDRAVNELIRAGEESASIQGVFQVSSPVLSALLLSLNIPENDGEIIVTRTLSKNRGGVKMNGVSISLSDLQKIAPYLADIHSQFDFAKILNPENYLHIIDGFARDLSSSYGKAYREKLSQYKQSKADYEALLKKKAKLEEAHDFYEFQYQELKQANLSLSEEEEITSEIALLQNYDKVYELSKQAEQIVREDFLDRLYELNKILGKLSSFQPQYQAVAETLDDRYAELTDTFSDLKKRLSDLDYDPSRLEVLLTREAELRALKRKYHKSIEELVAYRDELAALLKSKENIDDDIASAKKAMEEGLAQVWEKGKELSFVRRRTAKSIEKELQKNMEELLLPAKFEVYFAPVETMDESSLGEEGIDQVDFLIETNVGEGMKSLAKVISGGEASRISLSFKSVLIKANRIPTVVFDEIDVGVSGQVALAMAKKIRQLSRFCQVLAISHLPQVASLSDHHILIAKSVQGKRTYVSVKELSLEEKIEQIAYLISGGNITEKQREYAREMVLSNYD